MTKGFLTVAQNNQKCDYLRLAYGLALSIQKSQSEHKNVSVMVTPGTQIPKEYKDVFDKIIEIPWHDDAKDSEWKLENEWKAFHVTPYNQTIKLEADMLITESIEHWWKILNVYDLIFTSEVLTYRGDLITSDACRKTFTSNQLPNVYNGLMYFKKSDFALKFFDTARNVFRNWDFFANNLLDHTRPEFSTDVAYAMAVKLLEIEKNVTNRNFPTFVHLKPELMGWNNFYYGNNLTKILSDSFELKIEGYKQIYPVHYHDKTFLTDEMIKKYEESI